MDESQTELIAMAERICDRAHSQQLDKGGRPYVEHPRRVASYVAAENIRAVVAALLHDVLEDSALSSADLVR
jgi:(p)ppGpp synthase/HD superfamily hydrolase